MKKKMVLFLLLFVLLIGVTGCNERKLYEFDFFDGYIPGATYSGKIDLETGETKVKIVHGCSLLPDECAELDLEEENQGTLSETHLSKVKEILEKINYKDSDILISAISNILKGDVVCFEETSETCVELGNKVLDALISGELK